MKNRYLQAGFTLAELLAVVIIVAILSSLSLGFYKRSVEQSRFAEGLSVASAVVEAVNQYYLEEQLAGNNTFQRPTLNMLDMSIANITEDVDKPYSLFTPRFEVRLEANGNVRAYRGTAESNDYTYYIDIQPSFASSNKDQISCGAKNAKKPAEGKVFCESMGYTNCFNNGERCIKPKLTTNS